MKERNIALIIALILIILGITAGYFSLIDSKFNFYKSEISADGKIIKETLNYKPNIPYHTLYRSFYSQIHLRNPSETNNDNSIGIESVTCQEGQNYIQEPQTYDCYFFPEKIIRDCPEYTETNEYGCSFGNVYGFKRGKEYKIEAEYELYPENSFKINNNYYIKFIVYSKNNHKLLIKDKNFIIPDNAISKKYYFPQDDVIIYLPYQEAMNIIEQRDFEFDTNYFRKLFALLVCVIPGLFFFFMWYFFGKENIDPDMPEQLSMAPNKRKAWEVAAFFNPPFSGLNKHFFASLMLDFYRRKIIDLKMMQQKSFMSEKEELFLKINKIPENLDDAEKSFIKILKEAFNLCSEKYKKNEYFNIERVMQIQSVKIGLREKYKKLEESIKDNRKKYVQESIGAIIGIGFASLFIVFLLAAFSGAFFIIFLQFLAGILIILFFYKSALLIKFKERYYEEYKHWQAFKKYLSYSYTIKSATHQTIVMWEEYLLYATALGIPEKILKQGKNMQIVDEKHYAIYTGVYHSSALVSGGQYVSTGHGGGSFGGGGFGGAGGGGIGGGGGGGR